MRQISAMRERPRRDDRGAVLIVTLLVLFVVGTLCTTLLTQARVSINNSGNLADAQDRLAAAQSGIEHGIARVRADDTVCADQSATATTLAAALQVNGFSVKVTCRTTAGSSSGTAGYALVTTSTAPDSLSTSQGGSKTITGGTFVRGGLSLSGGAFRVTNGNFRQATAACQPASFPTMSPSFYTAACTSTIPTVPTPAVERPLNTKTSTSYTAQPATGAASDGTVCRVFLPGRYTTPPALDSSGAVYNYFLSGPYVFDFTGGSSYGATKSAWTLKQVVVIGGLPVDDSATGGFVERSTQFAFPQCARDAEAARATTGTGIYGGKGVTFQFAGYSHLEFNSGGHLELFTREPTTGDFRPSVLTSSDFPSSLGADDVLFDPQSGNTPDVVVHGEYIVPNAKVSLVATNTVHTEYLAGIATAKIQVSDSGSTQFLTLSNSRAAGNRTMELVAEASKTGGGRTVTSTAIMTIRNDDPDRVPAVASWRSDG